MATANHLGLLVTRIQVSRTSDDEHGGSTATAGESVLTQLPVYCFQESCTGTLERLGLPKPGKLMTPVAIADALRPWLNAEMTKMLETGVDGNSEGAKEFASAVAKRRRTAAGRADFKAELGSPMWTCWRTGSVPIAPLQRQSFGTWQCTRTGSAFSGRIVFLRGLNCKDSAADGMLCCKGRTNCWRT